MLVLGLKRRDRSGEMAREHAALIEALARLVAAADAACLGAAPQAVIAPLLADPALLEGRALVPSAKRYVRHLLHADPLGRHTLLALVWQPGQASPVHAHHLWCAFGVVSGVLTEHHFAPGDPPVPTCCRLLGAGACCHGPAAPHLIHRLGNCGTTLAVSIQAYGAAWDESGQRVNDIRAA
ncbi:MAG: cysteine dioxygenase family protein [Acetobacteraceae bacterium]|nr:cysteine dioxygenase family protein [Acetobacteraceae bacterium]MDW8398461.1 cysteine dioxygenase family protein [Acetobacteraceae bacterium]